MLCVLLGPNCILDHLFIGDRDSACDLKRLRDMGITHVINCAEQYCETGAGFYGNQFKYLGLRAEDNDDYEILQHHNDVYKFIEDARIGGGKCFIHCQAGINRSGVLLVSYVMVHKHIGPISAAKIVIRQRSVISNVHFQDELIKFANTKGLLILDKYEL